MITSAAIIIIGIKLNSAIITALGIIAETLNFATLVWKITNSEK